MFKLKMDTGNEAFQDDGQSGHEHLEAARILREIADKLDHGKRDGRCMDANGNIVGEWGFDD